MGETVFSTLLTMVPQEAGHLPRAEPPLPTDPAGPCLMVATVQVMERR